MSLRRLRLIARVLRGLQFTFIALLVVVLARTWSRAAEPIDAAGPQRDQAPTTVPPAVDFPAVEEFAAIWERDLRQPLHDPPPKEEPARQPTEVRPPVNLPRLLATFVEPNDSWALFDGEHGPRVYPVGAQLEGLEIVAIQDGVAKLRTERNVYEVRVPKKQLTTTRTTSGRRG